jgi:hypothetical protein
VTLARLRAFADAAPAAVPERCELCAQPLGERHDHLVERDSGKLRCACVACALLFDGRWARVLRRCERLEAAPISDESWAQMQLPIQLAFFVQSSARGRLVAFYPSAAGAVEAPCQPIAGLALAPDVEALLADRRRPDAPSWYRVSIDHCHELTGILRTHWRGLGGGTAVLDELTRFFRALDEVCRA